MSDPNILKEKAIEEEKINLLDEGDFMEYKVSELVELMCRLNCNVPEFFFFFYITEVFRHLFRFLLGKINSSRELLLFGYTRHFEDRLFKILCL